MGNTHGECTHSVKSRWPVVVKSQLFCQRDCKSKLEHRAVVRADAPACEEFQRRQESRSWRKRPIHFCLCGWAGDEMVNNTCPKCQLAAKDIYNKFDYLDQWARKIAAWARRKGFKTGWPTFERKLLQCISELMEAHEVFRSLAYNTDREATQDRIRVELADTALRVLDFLGATQRPDNETTAELFVRLMGENEQREFRHGKRF